MAKHPAERFASAGDLARAAAAALHGRSAPVVAAQPGPPRPTRQFPAQPARPHPPSPPQPPSGLVKQPRFSRMQLALLTGTVALFAVAAALAAAIVLVGGNDTSGPASKLAAPPSAAPTDPTTSSTTTSATAAPISGVSGTDAQGFIGHAARCDGRDSLVAAIKTASSLAVICQPAPGAYYYHGERLRDGANVQLANAVPSGGGFDATNPADGARYQVRPTELTILSNGHVDSAEPALEYGSAD
jgi:serine/threonine-protein kinase